MKKLTTCVSCAFALTAGLAMATTGDVKSVTLGTESAAVWQELPTASTGGTWTGTKSVADGNFVVDDATYTRGTGVAPAAAVVVCNFTLTASYLDDTADIVVPDSPQTGFCIVKSGTSDPVFKAYVGGEWLALQGATPPTEETAYTLKINLDYVNKKVQFVVGDTVLRDSAGATWFSNCQDSATDVSAVAFVGSGKVALIGRATNTIAAEVIEIIPEGESSPIDLNLTAEQLAAIGDPTATLANGHTALTSYILFGKASTAITETDVPVVKGNPTGGDADNVAISIPNLKLRTVTGATVSFQLKGSKSGETTTWHDVDGATSLGGGAFTFPANTTDRYFKVVTTITYGTAK